MDVFQDVHFFLLFFGAKNIWSLSKCALMCQICPQQYQLPHPMMQVDSNEQELQHSTQMKLKIKQNKSNHVCGTKVVKMFGRPPWCPKTQMNRPTNREPKTKPPRNGSLNKTFNQQNEQCQKIVRIQALLGKVNPCLDITKSKIHNWIAKNVLHQHKNSSGLLLWLLKTI